MAERGESTSWDGFATALSSPCPAAPPGVRVRPGADVDRRFAVYRNNVVVGLIEALRAGFPITERLVGGAFFRVMARDFAMAHRPDSPVLFEYGAAFPAFIADFAPARTVPYLAGIAELEVAWTVAYHAGDATAADPATLAGALSGLRHGRLLATRLAAHPAARVVHSAHPVVTIWRAQLDRAARVDLQDTWPPESALVTRPDAVVLVTALDPAGAAFATGVLDGRTVGEGGAAALALADDFDVGNTLIALARAGAIQGLQGGTE